MHTITDLPWECGKGWWPLNEIDAAAIDSGEVFHPFERSIFLIHPSAKHQFAFG